MGFVEEVNVLGFMRKNRYSHFDKLNDDLKALFGSTIPQLPKKTFVSWFRDKTDQEIDERR
jgi:hypothetical protein